MLINKLKELIENEKNYIENIVDSKENSENKYQSTKEISNNAKIMKSFLNCDCKYYPPNAVDNDIICGYIESLQRSKMNDFIPVIVYISDNLIDAITMNAVIDSDDNSESIMDLGIRKNKRRDEIFKNGTINFEIMKIIERYRKNMLSKDFSGGKELLDEMIKNNREYFGGYELEKDEFNVEDDSPINMNNIDFEDKTESHGEVLIAEIPVKNPWEIFVYIPFGGWNDCPENEDIMGISKYWFEKYGAIPFMISYNTLEYIVENHVDNEDKVRFTEEFYAFCPDSVDRYMEEFNLKKLAKKIYKNKIWHFCWN